MRSSRGFRPRLKFMAVRRAVGKRRRLDIEFKVVYRQRALHKSEGSVDPSEFSLSRPRNKIHAKDQARRERLTRG